MKRLFILNIILALSLPFKVQAGNWHLDKIMEGVMDIWIIRSCSDLVWLSDVNSLDADDDGINDFANLQEKWAANYRLGDNIPFNPDYSEMDWNNDGILNEADQTGFLPIGNSAEPFTGVFDGAYDTISNIWISSKGKPDTGLFGVIKGAAIRHLGLENIMINTDNKNIGGMVGQAIKTENPGLKNEISNCYVKGEINSTVAGESNAGGLIGMAEDVQIKECYTVMLLKGESAANRLGGFIGSLSGGDIIDCYANAWVSGNTDIGLLAGYVDQSQSNTHIQNCYSIGSGLANVSASAGGFIGRFNAGVTNRCYWIPEISSNNRPVGTSASVAIVDITAIQPDDLAEPSSFTDWDFNKTWEIGDLSSKNLVLEIDYKPVSVSSILQDGEGDFDPWNTERWADWYNDKGEITKPFLLNSDITFDSSKQVWIPVRSPEFDQYILPFNNLFIIESRGIIIDGNGITIDVMSGDQKLPVEQLYNMGRDPWLTGSQLQAFQCNRPERAGTDTTVLKNITIKGFRRGLKIDFIGLKSHPMIVKNCKFIRNGIGIYTNANSTVFKNCEILESGNGGIYSGSKSSDNKWIGNTFRDNTLSQYQFSYGDFIGDTYYNTVIEGNHFLASLVNVNQRLHGISTFRNQGEGENLREQMPHNNIIRNNHFDGYSVAITMGSRMGRNVGYDITGEGRDYAFYNLIDSNVFENTAVAIKINTEGNTIRSNQFTNVDNEIVLHCVFFRLKNTVIEDQDSDSVKLWYVLDDYDQYKDWFQYQDDLNGFIEKSEKRIEVRSQDGSPVFPVGLDSLFILNPPDKGPEFMIEDHRFGLPLATDTGEFTTDLPGHEIVAIWDEPISRVGTIDYYTILIMDDQGTEINRSGRSEFKWGQLAVGYFLSSSGEMEIAVVPAEPVNGKYPVYIFTRGFREPKKILYPDNTDPSITISSNQDHKLVVSFNSR